MKKKALVTGARKGLGFAWCKILAQEGYEVYLSARKLEQAEQAAKNMEGEVYPIVLDVMDEKSIIQAVEIIGARNGHLDLLVNNAGVNPKDHPDKKKMESSFYLDKLEAQTVLETLHANSIAPMLMLKNFRKLLSNSPSSKVINISSWLGSVSNTKMGVHFAYCGSKNLLNMFNKIAANDLKDDGITTVSVNPGWVQTDMGGAKGEFTAEQSVRNIMTHVLNEITLEDTGKFFNHNGEIHPW